MDGTAKDSALWQAFALHYLLQRFRDGFSVSTSWNDSCIILELNVDYLGVGGMSIYFPCDVCWLASELCRSSALFSTDWHFTLFGSTLVRILSATYT